MTSKYDDVIALLKDTTDTVFVPIICTAPMIQHKFDEKIARQMEDERLGKAVKKREIRKPEEEFLAAMHRTSTGGYGIPAGAFKGAMIDGIGDPKKMNVTKKYLKTAFFVIPDDQTTNLVTMQGATPEMRTDMVRLSNGAPDVRYRPEYKFWWATLKVEFDPSQIGRDVVINLVEKAGKAGIGDWRPSAKDSFTGTFGTWRVMRKEDILEYIGET